MRASTAVCAQLVGRFIQLLWNPAYRTAPLNILHQIFANVLHTSFSPRFKNAALSATQTASLSWQSGETLQLILCRENSSYDKLLRWQIWHRWSVTRKNLVTTYKWILTAFLFVYGVSFSPLPFLFLPPLQYPYCGPSPLPPSAVQSLSYYSLRASVEQFQL